MLTSKTQKFIVAGALAALFTAPSTARADAYVFPCGVTYDPSAAYGHGDHGSVTASYYTEPACEGSYVATRRYCSEGASSTACAGPYHQYGDTALAALFAGLVRAVESGIRVYERQYYCQTSSSPWGGSYACGRTVSFYAD
ncbi:MAG: hypothetical protein ACRBN8_09550 [Nannocystales bacterium]